MRFLHTTRQPTSIFRVNPLESYFEFTELFTPLKEVGASIGLNRSFDTLAVDKPVTHGHTGHSALSARQMGQ